MKTYRLTFRLSAPSLTPWQADTLFGHVCWAIAGLHGDARLADVLERCRGGDPPLILSDGFPPDALPRPLISLPAVTTGDVGAQVAAARRSKDFSARKWQSADEFRLTLNGDAPIYGSDAGPGDGETFVIRTHNQINRETGTAGDAADSGGLYSFLADWAAERVVFLRVADDLGFDWREALDYVASEGFGKRKAVGYGAISAWSALEHDGFGEPDNPNGFVSLSCFVPASGDPTDGYWRTFVKFGKAGNVRGASAHPFKRPSLMLSAGSTFYTNRAPRSAYGRMVDHVAPGWPDISQYAFAFAVPILLRSRPEVTT